MGRLFIGMVLGIGLLCSCAPSKEVRSAGQVGCSPNEVQISEQDYHFGLMQSGESWVAQCRGRVFICSQMNETGDKNKGLASFFGSEQIGCREQAETPEAEQKRVARQAAATANALKLREPAPPPTGAAGFAFGDSPEEARQRCEAAGKEWRANDKTTTCSGGAVDVGPIAGVGIEWCDRRTCAISIEQYPKQWSKQAAELKARLEAKYGKAAESAGTIPVGCRSDAQFEQCIESKSLGLRYLWRWASGESLELVIGDVGAQPPAAPAIRLLYRRPSGALSASAL